LARMPTMMKRDITPQPLQVNLLRSQGEVTRAHLVARNGKQSGSRSHGCSFAYLRPADAGLVALSNQFGGHRSTFLSDVFGVFHHPGSVIEI
jgi:hypothetical protein